MKKHPVSESPQKMQFTQAHYFLFFLLFLSLFACYKIIQPYIHPFILAILLAVMLQPIYRKIEWLVRGRKNLAAFLLCSLLTLVVAIPLTFLVFALIQQGVQSFNNIYDWVSAGEYKHILESPVIIKMTKFFDQYVPDIQKFFPDFNLNNIRLDQLALQASSTIGKQLLNQGGQLFGNITALVGKFFLMLFAFFFIVRDQEKIFAAILHLIPLSASHEHEIVVKVKSVAQSALLGTFATAVAQGILGGIAFQISGLPGLFWGTMMAFTSLIPLVGTSLIWLPASLYLFLSGHWGYGIFMVLWCAIFVGLIDNILRPLFMKESGGGMGTLLIFFSILGGINYFGLIGLLYGPLIVGLTLVFLYIYNIEFGAFLNQQDRR